MLDWIFEAIIDWVARTVTSVMDAVSGIFLNALGTDMLAMEEGANDLETGSPGKKPKTSEQFTFSEYCVVIDCVTGASKFTFYLCN